jgi:signal transduction histidine kinase
VMRPLLGDPARGFVKIARDLTPQRRAQEELQRAHDELEVRVGDRTRELHEANEVLRREVSERGAAQDQTRRLLRQIVTVQEDERRRISRDLHDQLGQQLTALRLKLELLGEGVSHDAELSRQVEAAKVLAEGLDIEVDFLAWELRPSALDELGLVTALENYVREWAEHFGVPAEFHTAGLEDERLDPSIEIQLYRITQEALNNVYKHASARQVTVLLELRDGDVALIVEDDGRGFDQAAAATHGTERLGLGGMRERATLVGGTLQIESEPNQGTAVFVRFPFTPSAEGAGSR